MQGKNVYEHTSSYDKPLTNKGRTLKNSVNRGFFGRIFKYENGKLNTLGKIGTGVLAGLTIAGGGMVARNIIEENFVHSRHCEEIVEAINDNYDTSQYLQTTIPKEAYEEYTLGVLERVIDSEPGMMKFIRSNDIDGQTWAYILTGEVDRAEITDGEILGSLIAYYSSLDADIVNNLTTNESVLGMAHMASICTSSANKDNAVRMVDAIVGSKSISNSEKALQYKIQLNTEAIERIEYNTQEQLMGKIETNNNFRQLVQDYDNAVLYLMPYINDFYNTRVEFVNSTIADENAPQELKDALAVYEGNETLSYCPDNLRKEPIYTMDTPPNNDWSKLPIAYYEEYKQYIDSRNGFYEDIIKAQKSPEEAIENLKTANAGLHSRIHDQKNLSGVDLANEFYEIDEMLIGLNGVGRDDVVKEIKRDRDMGDR